MVYVRHKKIYLELPGKRKVCQNRRRETRCHTVQTRSLSCSGRRRQKNVHYSTHKTKKHDRDRRHQRREKLARLEGIQTVYLQDSSQVQCGQEFTESEHIVVR
jgi:hypothetical protein